MLHRKAFFFLPVILLAKGYIIFSSLKVIAEGCLKHEYFLLFIIYLDVYFLYMRLYETKLVVSFLKNTVFDAHFFA